jgi:nitrite reductase/ring-hydroxylating ferredoxin subunit
MALVAVGRIDDLQEGVPKHCAVGSRRVNVVLWRGEVFACRDVCAHQNTPLQGGCVEPRLRRGADPTAPVVDESDPVLSCPRHAFKFDLRTGHCVSDPFFRIRVYDVTVEDGVAYVDFQ